MKSALAPFAHNLSQSAPNFVEMVAPSHTPQTDDFQDRVNAIAEPKSPAFVAGELAAKGFNWLYDRSKPWVSAIMDSLPYVGLPGAEAKAIPSPIDESYKLVVEKAMQHVQVVGTKSKKEEQQVRERFERILLSAIEGELSRDSIDLWLSYPMHENQPTFVLNVDIAAKAVLGGEAQFDPSTNEVSLFMKNSDNALMQSIRHEVVGHAADMIGYFLAVKKGEAKYGRPELDHHNKDKDAEISNKLLAACKDNVYNVKQKAMTCITNKKDCNNNKPLRNIRESYNREAEVVFSKSNMHNVVGRKLEIGEFLTYKNTKLQIVETKKEDYETSYPKKVQKDKQSPFKDSYTARVVDDNKVASFFYTIDGMFPTLELYPDAKKTFETGAYLNQVLPDELKKTICPDLYSFDHNQVKTAQGWVKTLQEKSQKDSPDSQKKSGRGRDDL